MLLGLSVMVGWMFNISILKSVFPGYSSMKFNTALLFVFCGAIVNLLAANKYTGIYKILSALLLLFAMLTFTQNLFHYNAGIDEIFISDNDIIPKGNPYAGRMAPCTAVCFSLLAVSFLLIKSKSLRSLAQFFLHVVTLISFIAIVGYLFEVPVFYKISYVSSMAVHTAAAFFILSTVGSFFNNHLGITGLFTGSMIGHSMIRRLFPSMLIILLVLGILRIQAQKHGLVTEEFGIALFYISFILVGLLLLWSTARSLNKIDRRRDFAEQEVIAINKNLEKLVAQRNQELRAIFDAANASIIGTDTTGLITHFNKGAENMLGYTCSEIIGIKTPVLFHSKDELIKREEELTDVFKHEIKGFDGLVAFAKAGKFESREWTYIKKSGAEFPVQLVVTAILDEHKNITGYLGIATDITELTAAKHELEILTGYLQNKNSQLLNFAHITSHNLRSPVGNLNTLLQLYKESRDIVEKEMLFDKFEMVLHHLTSTLNELIEALKIQVDINKERELLSFEEIFTKIKETFAGDMLDTHAVISSDFSGAAAIKYPKSYLESIMLNLFSNGLKYKSPGRVPRICFKTETINNGIILTAGDNGLGINLKKYGDRLFGLNQTFHHHAEAKGVGLYIIKTQIEAMGGQISAESEVGKGTTFTIVFDKNSCNN